MNIQASERGGFNVLALEGRLDADATPSLQKEIDKLVEAGEHKLIMDFAGLDYISSAGLRIVLATAKKAKGLNGVFRVSGFKPVVKEIFDISGFTGMLDTYETLDQAAV